MSGRVTDDLARCFRAMECDDRPLLHVWIPRRADRVEFEVRPVTTSADARAALAPCL